MQRRRGRGKRVKATKPSSRFRQGEVFCFRYLPQGREAVLSRPHLRFSTSPVTFSESRYFRRSLLWRAGQEPPRTESQLR